MGGPPGLLRGADGVLVVGLDPVCVRDDGRWGNDRRPLPSICTAAIFPSLRGAVGETAGLKMGKWDVARRSRERMTVQTLSHCPIVSVQAVEFSGADAETGGVCVQIHAQTGQICRRDAPTDLRRAKWKLCLKKGPRRGVDEGRARSG